MATMTLLLVLSQDFVFMRIECRNSLNPLLRYYCGHGLKSTANVLGTLIKYLWLCGQMRYLWVKVFRIIPEFLILRQ